MAVRIKITPAIAATVDPAIMAAWEGWFIFIFIFISFPLDVGPAAVEDDVDVSTMK